MKEEKNDERSHRTHRITPNERKPFGVFGVFGGFSHVVVVLLLVVLLGGCASAPATEIRKPEIYPDRASADAVWKSYLWAWRAGDVDALTQMYSLWMKEVIDAQVAQNGKDAVSDWYRRDAERMTVEEARWVRRTDDLAYLDARIAAPGAAPVEVRFSFLRRADGWTVSGKKPLH